jgi:hypothetical protein
LRSSSFTYNDCLRPDLYFSISQKAAL